MPSKRENQNYYFSIYLSFAQLFLLFRFRFYLHDMFFTVVHVFSRNDLYSETSDEVDQPQRFTTELQRGFFEHFGRGLIDTGIQYFVAPFVVNSTLIFMA